MRLWSQITYGNFELKKKTGKLLTQAKRKNILTQEKVWG